MEEIVIYLVTKKVEEKERFLTIYQRDIDKILNDNQRYKWSNSHRYDYYKDRIDNRLERLEDEYERDIKRIEHNYSYNKNLMKRKKEIRKSQYKRDKERLKNVKDYY